MRRSPVIVLLGLLAVLVLSFAPVALAQSPSPEGSPPPAETPGASPGETPGGTTPPASPGETPGATPGGTPGASPGGSPAASPDAPAETPAPTQAGEATPAPTPTPPPPPTGILAEVQQRGNLVCGVNGELPGFSALDEGTGEYTGFDVDFCRAIAAAVLGNPQAVEFRNLTAQQRGPALQTGEIDVLIRNTTCTVSRETSWGLCNATTFYDGQGIMVRASLGVTTLEELDTASVCVQSGTTTELNLADQARALGITLNPQVFAELPPTYAAYEEGRCDAVTSDRSQLAARRSALANPDEHVILDVTFSKEPLGPMTPLGDDQWYNVVKWVVNATIEAEELGITAENVQSMVGGENPVIRRLLGDEGEVGQSLALPNDWVVGVISAVGNYGEIFNRNLGPDTPLGLERGVNNLWTQGGILYAEPYR
jgi:general L-amino acid transport system substrate-binding protein